MKLYYENNNLLSEKQFNNHLQLYEGYIDKVNDIDKKTKERKIENIASTRRDLQYALNGIILHELYFENVQIQKNSNIEILKNETIFKNSEELTQWRDEFFSIALNTRGWVVYAHELRTDKFINFSLTSHDEGLVCSMVPIIILDMYEHAYYTDYSNDKKTYINKFIDNIDWEVVYKRIN